LGLYLPDPPSWIFWVGLLLFITGLLLFAALSMRQNPDKKDNHVKRKQSLAGIIEAAPMGI
jgi:protein-S-isoprenylcysteine O-methyltransferase Ste14